MIHFVTLFNKNYMTRGLALIDSLRKTIGDLYKLYIIAVDKMTEIYFNENEYANIEIISLGSLIQKYCLKKTDTVFCSECIIFSSPNRWMLYCYSYL